MYWLGDAGAACNIAALHEIFHEVLDVTWVMGQKKHHSV